MKALSIIGILFSCLGILTGFSLFADLHQDEDQKFAVGVFLIVLSIYFLAFSIVATVVSFKKKKSEQ